MTAVSGTDGASFQADAATLGGPAAVVTWSGDLDAGAVPQLRRAFAEAIDAHADTVFDMTGVGLIDTAGLGLLVRVRQTARQAGGVLCLAGPSRFVRTVLHTMRLDRAFLIFEDRAAALAWLNSPLPAQEEEPTWSAPRRFADWTAPTPLSASTRWASLPATTMPARRRPAPAAHGEPSTAVTATKTSGAR